MWITGPPHLPALQSIELGFGMESQFITGQWIERPFSFDHWPASYILFLAREKKWKTNKLCQVFSKIKNEWI